MKKKLLLSLALIAIFTVILVITAFAAEPVEVWDISKTENDSVTAYLYEDENNSDYYTLTISGMGDMKDWGHYSDIPWYSSYRSKIASVTVDDGVTNIGELACYYCYSLTSVSVGDSVTRIGSYAFQNCENLTSAVFPNSVISIDTSAFSNCTSLRSVVLPNSVVSIGSYAFEGCASLTSMVIPNSVTGIGSYAFQYCESLTSIVIPDSVTSIGDWTFYNCKSLTIYCEVESQPSEWDPNWNYHNRPVVWNYKNTIKNDVFTFKGYSFNESGAIAVGFEIDYEAIKLYKELTDATLEYGAMFADYVALDGKQPHEVEEKIVFGLNDYNYLNYDFVVNDLTEEYYDYQMVIAAYIYDGEVPQYPRCNEASDP